MSQSIFATDLLKGQSAIVTGGGSGIGFAIAREFLLLGADVTIASRKLDKLQTAAAQLQEQTGRAPATQVCDIRDPEQDKALVQAHLDRHGRLDILINNAGGQFPSQAETYSPNGWEAVIKTNLTGTWFLTQQAALLAMIPQKGGRIVTIVANVRNGFPGLAHTGAARAGVINLTRSLSVEWAPHNILINAVAPGIIESSGLDVYPEAFIAHASSAVPLKRLGSCDDVAHAVTFLVSPAGSYVTGSVLAVDGGQQNWGTLWEVPEPVS